MLCYNIQRIAKAYPLHKFQVTNKIKIKYKRLWERLLEST
jgi:hypothetical protein